MRQNKDLFYTLFTKGESGFGNFPEVEGAIDCISRIRITQEAHDVGISKKMHDESLCRIYIDKINKCLGPSK